MQPMKTEAIGNFLRAKAKEDLADLYSFSMEVQVNVAQDMGERVEGDYNGRKWLGWTDGLTTWKPFRIPFKANSEPEYNDTPMKYDLAEHVEAIGMTGWDWKNKVSKWVAFDFDSIINHTDGLTHVEMQEICEAVQTIPWVTVRYSTSGKGYHFYVFLPEVATANHTEHAALARAVLGQLSALTKVDFQSKVDCCGGNMWVWHRKMKGDGLELVKQGTVLRDYPTNWKDHLDVIIGKRRKTAPQSVVDRGEVDMFDQLTGQSNIIPLDDEHKKLIDYLGEINAMWWWDADHHMLVTHTHWLEKAHSDLGLVGVFKTNSAGTNPHEQNCFMFPARGGAWQVRRFTQGVQESETWQQDGQGWTRCYFNRAADFTTACRMYNGIKDPKGNYVFSEAVAALEALDQLNLHPKIANRLQGRKTKLKMTNDNEVIIEIDKEPSDPSHEMEGWLNEGNKPWIKVEKLPFRAVYEPETANYDDIIRHLVTGREHKDSGWALKANDRWQEEPKSNIKDYLKSLGYKAGEADIILGAQIAKPWKIVSKPFQPEFPGDREWNRNAAQLRFLPSVSKDNLSYPTWLKIITRLGSSLNDVISQDPWCRVNGITQGADYLKCWIASLLQKPEEPLPYLFLFGPQNNGKSTFFEALRLLFTSGVMDASAAMNSSSAFNKELEGMVLCYIDEKDLQKKSQAYNRIKEWVTAREILIHEKRETPYTVPNTTHWIQCANDPQYCPVFPGDTRITMVYIDHLAPEEMINKRELFVLLEKEAPDFLASVLALELPASNDRLNVPVLNTSEKYSAAESNKSALERFFDEFCQYAPGYMLKFSDLFDKFEAWLDPQEAHEWSKISFGKNLPAPFIKARARGNAQWHIGNITWRDEDIVVKKKYVIRDNYLEELND